MRAFLLSLLLVVATLALAACGDDDTSSNGSGGDVAAIEHLHVDGAVRGREDGFVITTPDGETYDFEYGPAVKPAEVRALEAAGAQARVTFRPTEDTPVATDIGEKPDKEGLETYEGLVVRVTATELVVDGADGERTFSIAGTDHAAFDPDHLEEHREREEPIVVYFDPEDPGTGIAYEDA